MASLDTDCGGCAEEEEETTLPPSDEDLDPAQYFEQQMHQLGIGTDLDSTPLAYHGTEEEEEYAVDEEDDSTSDAEDEGSESEDDDDDRMEEEEESSLAVPAPTQVATLQPEQHYNGIVSFFKKKVRKVVNKHSDKMDEKALERAREKEKKAIAEREALEKRVARLNATAAPAADADEDTAVEEEDNDVEVKGIAATFAALVRPEKQRPPRVRPSSLADAIQREEVPVKKKKLHHELIPSTTIAAHYERSTHLREAEKQLAECLMAHVNRNEIPTFAFPTQKPLDAEEIDNLYACNLACGSALAFARGHFEQEHVTNLASFVNNNKKIASPKPLGAHDRDVFAKALRAYSAATAAHVEAARELMPTLSRDEADQQEAALAAHMGVRLGKLLVARASKAAQPLDALHFQHPAVIATACLHELVNFTQHHLTKNIDLQLNTAKLDSFWREKLDNYHALSLKLFC
jgi:hypothetical protein